MTDRAFTKKEVEIVHLLTQEGWELVHWTLRYGSSHGNWSLMGPQGENRRVKEQEVAFLMAEGFIRPLLMSYRLTGPGFRKYKREVI